MHSVFYSSKFFQLHTAEGLTRYNKMINFTDNAVCELTKTGWDQRTPEELGTQITIKNFILPFSVER